MDAGRLGDLLAQGRGRAARQIGGWCDAYRPDGPGDPLAPSRRYMRLPAAFVGHGAGLGQPVGYGHAQWVGTFDSAYTQVGDYLVDPGADPASVWFIAAQQRMSPPLCIQANRTLSAYRPAVPTATGLGSYGGVTLEAASLLLNGWPASVLSAGAGGSDAGLPAGAAPGLWSVLLPAVHAVVLRNGDLLADDLGRTAVIASNELSALGWRLLAKQTTT